MSVLRKLFSVLTAQPAGCGLEQSASGTAPHKSVFLAADKYWLDGTVPAFPVNADKVKVIREPSTFYKILLEKCSTAEERITLASLYLGTGSLEQELVRVLYRRLEESQGKLRVRVLLDHARGSRGKHNSRHMLLPLIGCFQDSCQVCLYHTPLLRRPWKWLVPARYNELLGLQHMKLYLFDDSVIISGANLSHDYFTNRQDRYLLVEGCKPLADFLHGLVATTCDFSLRLDERDRESVQPGWDVHPYRGDARAFVSAAGEHVRSFCQRAAQNSRALARDQAAGADTWLLALVEMGQLGVHLDSAWTQRVLECALPGSTVHLATGYFNLTNQYVDAILHRSAAAYHLLMAHPSANGFLGARGPAGGIPAAYRQLAGSFLCAAAAAGQQERVCMWEYQRPGWTYHGKGLWYTLPREHAPRLSVVGSSNMGARSVQRDLEAQVAVLTDNHALQQSLAEERDGLFSHGTRFTSQTAADFKAPLWVSVVVRLFANYF